MRERIARALYRIAVKIDPAMTVTRSYGVTDQREVMLTLDPGAGKQIHRMLLDIKRRNGGKELGLQ